MFYFFDMHNPFVSSDDAAAKKAKKIRDQTRARVAKLRPKNRAKAAKAAAAKAAKATTTRF